MSEHDNDGRVQPPDGDDDSLREYGRQLAMDSLLELALGGRVMVKASPRPAGPRRRRMALLVPPWRRASCWAFAFGNRCGPVSRPSGPSWRRGMARPLVSSLPRSRWGIGLLPA